MTDFDQTFAFTAATFTAPSLHALLGNLAELRLVVTEESAYLHGDGYREEIAYVFTRSVFDWSATTRLLFSVPFPPGAYSLGWRKDIPVVFVAGIALELPDGPVETTLTAFDEEE